MTQATIDLIDRLLLKALTDIRAITGSNSKDAESIMGAYAEFGEWAEATQPESGEAPR